MKTYIRILGILSFLTSLGLITFWGYGLMELIQDSPEDLWVLLLLSIPLYALTHFIISHRFGFNYKIDFTKSQKASVVSLSIIFGLSFLLMIIPNIARFNTVLKQSEELSQLRDLGFDTTAHGYSANLAIKYHEGEIHLKLETKSSELFSENKKIPIFSIYLNDQDNFLIEQITINPFSKKTSTIKVDSSKITVNVSSYMTPEDYKRIRKWDLGVNK